MNDRKPRNYWTFDKIQEEALKYSRRVDFYNESQSAYAKAVFNKIIDVVCSHMLEIAHKWTDIELLESAKKYRYKVDWKKSEPKAYFTARERAIYNECCKHMDNKYHVNIIDSIKKRAYQVHCRTAKQRKYITYLSLEQYIKICETPCVYCKTFSERKNSYTNNSILFNSCDRKNNEPYYKLENSQSTCFSCQTMKMDMTDLEFKEKINKIYKLINNT